MGLRPPFFPILTCIIFAGIKRLAGFFVSFSVQGFFFFFPNKKTTNIKPPRLPQKIKINDLKIKYQRRRGQNFIKFKFKPKKNFKIWSPTNIKKKKGII